jgi:outer membrane receptor protein involved in Fe transport
MAVQANSYRRCQGGFYLLTCRRSMVKLYYLRHLGLASLTILLAITAIAQQTRRINGTVMTKSQEAIPGLAVTISSASGQLHTTTDKYGNFQFTAPIDLLSLNVQGKNIQHLDLTINPGLRDQNFILTTGYIIPPIHESLVITGDALEPTVNHRNDEIYKNTLFSRDDQVFHILDAGINAGQHEGGGKSLEIKRFGFNLDHGGVSGGLKVLVDNTPQNQSTQGHGQGYLGQLKTLTPELVQEVDILNGPFKAEYGDFSGLGVVHIRLKESLPDQVTARIQAGSFNTYRTFLGFSPTLQNSDFLVAYEGSRTDGPFHNPLRYKRDNITGNFIHHLDDKHDVGIKVNMGGNNFFSSGQLPLDEIAEGKLHRFGFIDPDGGGRVLSGTVGTYFRKEGERGDILKMDGFLARSLFDLYSNFTFYLNDQINGDGIQQHDSRLQQGANIQYLRPNNIFGAQGLLTSGVNFHANQINVGLYPRIRREPIGVTTKAQADMFNVAGYIQQSISFLQGRLHMEAGLRYDYFNFDVEDKVEPLRSGEESAGRFQPKASIAFTPSYSLPVSFYFNYGRGISSQDARGIAQYPTGPKVATTDFYQAGASHYLKKISISTSLFLIDRSNEQIYIPDDGSFEFKGPSRAYGYEMKQSVKLTDHVTLNGGLTQVMNAFYRGTSPRVYVDSAPHTVANAGLTLSDWKGFSGSMRYRHISSYRLDGEDPNIRAIGLDVVDFYMSSRLKKWLDFNLALDNLTNKRYYETQNYFESRVRSNEPAIWRIHATPGYPITLTMGLTFRFFNK